MATRSKIVFLRADAELTEATVELHRAAWSAAVSVRGCRVVLEMTACEMVTTPGLGLLMELNAMARVQGGVFVVAGLRARVLEVVTRTQLAKVLTLAGDVESAKRRLQE